MSRKAQEMSAPETPGTGTALLEPQSENETAETGTAEENPLTALLGEPEEFAVETATAREIPEEVKRFVDRGHELWKVKPRKWWGKPLPSEAVLRKVKRDAKAYAQSQGLVFRVKTTTEKTLLVYRVTPKAQNESGSANASTDGTHADNN